jgi:serine/threonine protein kinase/WD40 repeat protein
VSATRDDIKSIFGQAMALSTSAEREAYLANACAEHPELRAEVDSLLQAHQDAGSFLSERNAATIHTIDETVHAERLGAMIGGYKLLEEIGEGGFGLVYMAEQQQPVRRLVAVKVLKPGMDTRQVVARFEAERQALALMDHPNIAKVLDAGETDSGRPYFAMELVRGVPITDFCDKHNLPPRQRLELFVTVCQAVQHAHHKAIIHRDIKPSNVLVTLHDGKPVVKVIDFGIAKALGQRLTDKTLFTGFVQMIGTPLYMSPEQAEMSGLDVDTRSDIYSLGVLLYELLTGATPFDKERLKKVGYEEMRRIICEEEPARPSTRLSTLGLAAATVSARRQSDSRRLSQLLRGELDWIVMKALEKDRNRRYETATALAADVERFLHDETVLACPPSTWYRLRKMARRHRWAIAMVSVVAAALVVIAAGSLTSALFLVQALHQSEKNRLRAEGAEETATERLYGSLLAQARTSRLTRSPGQRFKTLQAVAEAAKVAHKLNRSEAARAELRTEAIAALCLPDMELAREGPNRPVGATAFVVDPAFRRYAWADKDGTIRVCRLDDDKNLLQLPGAGAVDFYGGLQFSPDGRFLHQMCSTPNGLRSRLWDLTAPTPTAVLDDDHNGLAFCPDGREVAVSYRVDRTVRFLETATGRELRRCKLDVVPNPRELRWNPKLPQLLVNGSHLVDVDRGTTAVVGPNVPLSSWSATWHPEGRLLALSGADSRIYLWDIAGGRLAVPPLDGHKRGGVVLGFNHAGDRLLSTDWGNGGHLWDTRSGRLLLNLPGLEAWYAFSPDDLTLCAADARRTRIYRFRGGEELCTLLRHGSKKGYYWPGCSSLDQPGRLFAVPTDGGFALVDVARAEETALLALNNVVPLCFASDGALWTHGGRGLARWPTTTDGKSKQRRFGPPRWIYAAPKKEPHGSSTDARVVAIPLPNSMKGALVRHQDSAIVVPVGPQEDVRSCAVTPDGRWVATASWGLRDGAGVKIWNARDGGRVKDLPVEGLCNVRASPGGNWLFTTGGGPRLWHVGTWQEGPDLRGVSSNPWGAFTRDDKLLALGDEIGVVRLIVPETGGEVARLTIPEQDRLCPCCFTPDGLRLIAAGVETTRLYIFNLRAIRAGLGAMDLDWDAPPLPNGAGRDTMPPPLSVSFDLGDR